MSRSAETHSQYYSKRSIWARLRRMSLCLSALVSFPIAAHASGRPGLIFVVGGLMVWYLAGGCLLFVVPGLKARRLLPICVYLTATVIAWAWFLNVNGPDFTAQSVLMAVLPVAILAGLIAFRRRNR